MACLPVHCQVITVITACLPVQYTVSGYYRMFTSAVHCVRLLPLLPHVYQCSKLCQVNTVITACLPVQ